MRKVLAAAGLVFILLGGLAFGGWFWVQNEARGAADRIVGKLLEDGAKKAEYRSLSFDPLSQRMEIEGLTYESEAGAEPVQVSIGKIAAEGVVLGGVGFTAERIAVDDVAAAFGATSHRAPRIEIVKFKGSESAGSAAARETPERRADLLLRAVAAEAIVVAQASSTINRGEETIAYDIRDLTLTDLAEGRIGRVSASGLSQRAGSAAAGFDLVDYGPSRLEGVNLAAIHRAWALRAEPDASFATAFERFSQDGLVVVMRDGARARADRIVAEAVALRPGRLSYSETASVLTNAATVTELLSNEEKSHLVSVVAESIGLLRLGRLELDGLAVTPAKASGEITAVRIAVEKIEGGAVGGVFVEKLEGALSYGAGVSKSKIALASLSLSGLSFAGLLEELGPALEMASARDYASLQKMIPMLDSAVVAGLRVETDGNAFALARLESRNGAPIDGSTTSQTTTISNASFDGAWGDKPASFSLGRIEMNVSASQDFERAASDLYAALDEPWRAFDGREPVARLLDALGEAFEGYRIDRAELEAFKAAFKDGSGSASLSRFALADVSGGRFGSVVIQGLAARAAAGAFDSTTLEDVVRDDGEGSFRLGEMSARNLSFVGLFKTASSFELETAAERLARLPTIESFRLADMEAVLSKSVASLKSFDLTCGYETGPIPTRLTAKLDKLVAPVAQNEFAADPDDVAPFWTAVFGRDPATFDFTADLAWRPETGRFDVHGLAAKAEGVGALTVKGSAVGIDADLFSKDVESSPDFAKPALEGLDVVLIDSGMVARLIEHVGAGLGQTPDAFRAVFLQSVKEEAARFADPAFIEQAGASLERFLTDPSSLSVRMRPTEPASLLGLAAAALMDPAGMFAALNLSVAANEKR